MCVLLEEILMNKTRQVILVALATTISAPITAAEQSPIIVTATRTAQTADETIAPVIVIKREQIESNPNAALSDLLRMHAGIDIGRNGGPGQQTSIFMRGTESNHTLVMIDGVKINPGTLGTPAIQNLNLNLVEQIEIVKGPRSTLYGSDAIGGVINIITRKGKEGSQYNVNAGYGSFNTKTVGFSSHNKQDDTAAGITVEATESDGYAIRTTSPIERGYDNLNIHLYGKKRMGTTDFKVSHWNASGKSEYLDFFLNPVDQDFENSTTSLDATNNITADWLIKVKISHTEDNIEQNQSVDFATTKRDVFDWQNDIQLGDAQLLTAGIYLSNEKTKASSFGTNYDESTIINAVYLQDDILFGNNHIIAGVRHTNHETFGSHNTGSIDYSFQLNKSIKIIAGIASGFRSPDSTDRFGSSGNPNLKPEESTNTEIGIHYDIGTKHNIRLNHFNNEITNLIEYDLATSMMQNIDEAQIRGTEINYQLAVDHWSIKASAILQKPENKATGAVLSRRSEASYTFSIYYKSEDLKVGLDMLHTDERDNSAYDSTILDSYTLVNLGAQYSVTKNLFLKGRIENLFDEDYELASTYRSPERSYYINLAYVF